jgi:hypothetical protein
MVKPLKMLCLPAQKIALSQSLPNANYQQTDNNLGFLFAQREKNRFRARPISPQRVAFAAESGCASLQWGRL